MLPKPRITSSIDNKLQFSALPFLQSLQLWFSRHGFYIYNRFITPHIPTDLLQSSQPSLIWQTAGTNHASILIGFRANLNPHIRCLRLCIPFASQNESFHIFPNTVQPFVNAQDLNIGAPVYGYIALFKTQKWLFAKKVCMINCTTGDFDSLISVLISSSLMGHVKGLGRH